MSINLRYLFGNTIQHQHTTDNNTISKELIIKNKNTPKEPVMSVSISNIVPACMACTMAEHPDPIPNTGSIYITGFDDNSIEVLPSREYFQYTMASAKNSVRRPATYSDIFGNPPTHSAERFSPMNNNNRKNRKYHNIHQPGRTNCTQRYQGK